MFYTQQVEMGNMNKLARLADRKTTPFYRVSWSIKKITACKYTCFRDMRNVFFLKCILIGSLKRQGLIFFFLFHAVNQ